MIIGVQQQKNWRNIYYVQLSCSNIEPDATFDLLPLFSVYFVDSFIDDLPCSLVIIVKYMSPPCGGF
jgi:hypothetical protein